MARERIEFEEVQRLTGVKDFLTACLLASCDLFPYPAKIGSEKYFKSDIDKYIKLGRDIKGDTVFANLKVNGIFKASKVINEIYKQVQP